MQIKDLSRATGVDVETIRYYEKQGLLPEPARRDNGYRDYEATHLERLAFIRHCRALDMPLADVHQLLGYLDAPEDHFGKVDLLVDEQLTRVRARLKSMRALEKQLLQLRARCSGTHEGRCGILDELVSAAHGEACACHSG
ncbi:Cd(II)/Pb(II)-responsive transcriptional regulator [Hydrogenophaga sp. PBL-H3]|uniref:Cd(II)/Pb(II)-responsive transcriptional regulator n=1 Tax=Hydrogenophaga sp. PBL-H3 TaxID=434010 RepID=UPI00131F7948|nr:Cd(II)/Pb(II)-responsive transcriptional regulator [Hydrogenophaga sp. PBL-H3]QHE74567.1 Cd(II)/Pb(II)-responsive transcriptional regulator [Hydrogenophaga sp. PBL-H3]QHE78992.1 Cd(II)/Pb(II)-responsive transcriptional regulator [Hydrogenophaga sp. PBL-H3]